jgi:hypothetical protein
VNELRAHALGSFIGTSWGIYRREWLTLFLIYVIPLLVVHIVDALLKVAFGQDILLIFVMGALQMLASLFVAFPATVAVSEICLGIRPNVGRSYKRAFAQPGKLFGSYFLALLIIILGFVALFIPGVVFSLWYTFVGPVVVLEGFAGRAALRRSRELGKGYYLRNFGVYMVAIIVVLLIAVFFGGVIGAASYFAGINPQIAQFIIGLFSLLVAPPLVVLIVLIYYDMRVRKEMYGAAQLADDLRS